MYKISHLSKSSGLSRTALLYYDKIGLLSPSHRTESGYRLYTEDDMNRLRRIVLYKEMGISLEEIKDILDNSYPENAVLDHTLVKLEEQIEMLRRKQRSILKMMNTPRNHDGINKEAFLEAMHDIGMDEEQSMQFHKSFEMNDSAGHRAFLEFLGLSDDEINNLLERISC